jgi:outer membrane protein TolC
MNRPSFLRAPCMRFGLPLAASVLLAALVGCAQMPADGGVSALQPLTAPHLSPAPSLATTPEAQARQQQRVAELLAQPLSAEGAVQVMLLQSPAVQSQLLELGLAEADLAAASRLPNPGLSFARLKQGSEVEIDRGLSFSLSRLLTWPIAHDIETQRLAQARLQVASEVLRQAFEVRQSWYQAVAAQELLAHSQRVLEAAQVGAELAKRMRAAGNWNRLKESTELGFEAEALAQHQRAELALLAAREALARLLGVASPQAFTLPERLPTLPLQAVALPQAEQAAVDQRLDVQAARLWAEQKARQAGVTGRLLGFVNVLDINAGVVNNTSRDAPRQRGYEISLELPIFDWGALKATQAELQHRQAMNQATLTAQQAQSEVRVLHAAYLAQFKLARHQVDTVLPLRKQVSQEMLLRYNGMLIGVFDLLADAREQSRAVQTAIEAQRDAWVAQAALEMALSGPGAPLSAPSSGSASANAAAPTPAEH